MNDSSTIIVLLTIAVVLLSAIIVIFLGVVTLLLVRINRIVKNIEDVSNSVAEAAAWFTPAKLFGAVIDLFNRD